MTRDAIRSDKLAPPPGPFSQAIRSQGLIFVSGQIGLDPARTPVMGSYGENSLAAMATSVWYQLPPRTGDRPLVVLTCAPGNPRVPERVYRAWRDLHEDLAGLSANSRHVLSDCPDHYLNAGDPDLVAAAIGEVVRCARSGARLADLERAESDAE